MTEPNSRQIHRIREGDVVDERPLSNTSVNGAWNLDRSMAVVPGVDNPVFGDLSIEVR
jgi:hypothetical protein